MRKFLLALAFAALALLPGAASRTDAASVCGGDAGAWHCGKPNGGDASAYHTPKNAYAGVSGVWKPVYSTIGASASSVSGSASGAAASGSVSSAGSPNTTITGTPIAPVAYSWHCIGSPCPTINNAALQNPGWSASIGSASCQSSVTQNSTWGVTATDAIGTTINSNNINVGLTWNNTTSCIGPFTVTASDSAVNAGSCGPSGGGHTCFYTYTGSSTATISGGPTSGSLSYSWTYVSGATGAISGNGTPSISFLSDSQSCPQQQTCFKTSVWNVHVIDLVSGFTADGQASLGSSFTNNTG